MWMYIYDCMHVRLSSACSLSLSLPPPPLSLSTQFSCRVVSLHSRPSPPLPETCAPYRPSQARRTTQEIDRDQTILLLSLYCVPHHRTCRDVSVVCRVARKKRLAAVGSIGARAYADTRAPHGGLSRRDCLWTTTAPQRAGGKQWKLHGNVRDYPGRRQHYHAPHMGSSGPRTILGARARPLL